MEKHLSTQFDSELNAVSTLVMNMGGLVEAQVRNAITAFSKYSVELANEVLDKENRVNEFESEVDQEVSTIIARRQPTASDLRLLIGISKIAANLERTGDEAKKIARMLKSVAERGAPRTLASGDLYTAADTASGLLRKALDAFARLDIQAALAVIREDDLVDDAFDRFVRVLITYMMEDSRHISTSLDLLFLAKAVERVGDHAKNIAEQVIYIVRGADVRHIDVSQNHAMGAL